MRYVITCCSQYNEDEMVFLVDRKKCRHIWWSTDLSKALVYDNEEAAKKKAASFSFNNAEAITFVVASKINEMQEDERDRQQAMVDSEQGWDGHKDTF